MKKNKRKKLIKVYMTVIVSVLVLTAAIFAMVGNNRINGEDNQDVTAGGEPAEDQDKEEPSAEEPKQEEPAESEEVPKEEPSNPAQEPSGQQDAVSQVETPGAIDALVNKKNSLPSSYIPEDLKKLEGIPTALDNPEINQLREPAYVALQELFQAAKDEGEFELYARSGYRSYNTQESLYKSYVSNHGQAAADKYSAKPGQSEHQTGLAMDITCEAMNFQLDDTFGDTEEGKWVSENAHRFGFIVRYPKDKEDITGYFYEPWHIRFVGTELAAQVYESGQTLEEYLQSN
ncbi:MAG: D-alanyl-D-alanine carboxypeptidase family protein [Sedimentibacter sp.]|uniref:M15 family metallopeptidase n=1 Tax=Sedimentibacter sp. TaxID=1960295 RepID=UPI003158EF85